MSEAKEPQQGHVSWSPDYKSQPFRPTRPASANLVSRKEHEQEIAGRDKAILDAKALALNDLELLKQKDKRIAELEAQGHNEFREQNECIRRLRDRIEQMAAILEGVGHDRVDDEYAKELRCHDDCPACQWEKLKSQ